MKSTLLQTSRPIVLAILFGVFSFDLYPQTFAILSPVDLQYQKMKKNAYVIVRGKSKISGSMDALNKLPVIHFADRMSSTQNDVIVVNGRVTDENGVSMPGVNVLEKGTSNGTATDNTGHYSLSVQDENSTLVFSFIGYVTQEIAINNQSVINVIMAPDINTLQEVVVVGYGTQEKKDLTGSVASIAAEDPDLQLHLMLFRLCRESCPAFMS